MAVELESKVMKEIGLGQHYSWFNGSGSCRHIRNAAIGNLAQVASANGLTVTPEWLAYCRTASQVDNVGGGEYRLTNVWIACSYAIQDAIYRSEGGESAGYAPPTNPNWYFFRDEERQQWERRSNFGRHQVATQPQSVQRG